MSIETVERATTPRRNGGTAIYSYPQPWILVGKVVGHLTADLADEYILAMERAHNRGRKAIGFHDWAELPNYDSAARQKLTEWVLDHLDEMSAHHILVKSKLLAMGVSTASMVIGGNVIQSYTNRAAFERELQAACSK